jgi:hypothetical protein
MSLASNTYTDGFDFMMKEQAKLKDSMQELMNTMEALSAQIRKMQGTVDMLASRPYPILPSTPPPFEVYPYVTWCKGHY